MNKKLIVSLLICSFAIGGTVAIAATNKNKKSSVFEHDGYVISTGDYTSKDKEYFNEGTSYSSNIAGKITFKNKEGKKVTIEKESFAFYEDDDSIMSFSDGVLVNLADVDSASMNNYYIDSSLKIGYNGSAYVSETDDNGTMTFGDHVIKISNDKFLVRSPELYLHVDNGEVKTINDFIQVTISPDKIAYCHTVENVFYSLYGYIETANGYKVNLEPGDVFMETPSQEEGKTGKTLSLSKVTISSDDAIVLSSDELRRQIVPEIKIIPHNGANGSDGGNGKDGGYGYSGGPGKDAIVKSTVNSALPQITMPNTYITATEIRGRIAIQDTGSSLNSISEVDNYLTKFPATVTIKKVKTGQEIKCYQVEADYDISYIDDSGAFDFYQSDEVYFSTLPNALEPDTEYVLTVSSYYKNPGEVDLVLCREFITRYFYTDSLGVYLSMQNASDNRLEITADIPEEYKSSVKNAVIYFMTEEQATSFTYASIANTGNYLFSSPINLETLAPIEVKNLNPNTQYVCKVYVETAAGLQMISNQSLKVKTLKRSPTKDSSEKPTITFDRGSGAFLVWRPNVVDLDGGVVSYNYKVYESRDGGVVKEFLTSRTVYPSTTGPVEFRLPTEVEYVVEIEMIFNDNEKNIYYDLGTSDPVIAVGDTMPKVTLQTLEREDYNCFNGNMIVTLGSRSIIEAPTSLKKMVLQLEADKVSSRTVEILNSDTIYYLNGKDDTLGSVRYITTGDDGQCIIHLDLKNLFYNTNYFVTLYGYMSLGDNISGPVYQTIGTSSFHTYTDVPLLVQWDDVEQTGATFAKNVKITLADESIGEERKAYILDELKAGQVTIGLYSGTGAGKTRIAIRNFNSEQDLAQLFSSTGYILTQSAFGGSNLEKSGDYTLIVSNVIDRTFILGLGYQNEFTEIVNGSETVSAEATPPNLLKDPNQGVVATFIYNKDAKDYLQKVNNDLPDNAIIGIKLASSYDNVDRVGVSITYYAFEFKTYYNALSQDINPITEDMVPKLFQVTLPIDNNKNSVPYIALIFGGTPQPEAFLANGYNCYYTGVAQTDGFSLNEGMGRGYRYVFAYTVEYKRNSVSEQTDTYPNNHIDYAKFAQSYGGISHNGIKLFLGKHYILNSGIIEVPNILPDFHTYVDNQIADPLSQTAQVGGGKVILHYTWRDPDKLLVLDGTERNTKIIYTSNSEGEVYTDINLNPVGGTGWYSLDMTYQIQRGMDYNIEVYGGFGHYKIDYSEQNVQLGIEDEVNKTPITYVPVDWDWEKEFAKLSYNNLGIRMEAHYNENYIDFYVDGDSNSTYYLLSKASLMTISFDTVVNGQEEGNVKTFTYGLQSVDNQAYIRIATGTLGTDYLNKQFIVKSCYIYYDTGIQGWNNVITGSSDGVFLEYLNTSTRYGFASYLYGSDNYTIPANKALLTLDDSIDYESKIRSTVNVSDSSKDSKYTLYARTLIDNVQHGSYIYSNSFGVDSHTSSLINQLSGLYIAPKRAATIDLLKGKYVGDILNEMTPTITLGTVQPSATVVGVTINKVDGFKEGGTIYAAAYSNRNDALLINTQYVRPLLTIQIKADGNPTQSMYEFTNLIGQQKYYLAFYYVNPNGKSVLLLDSSTTQGCIREVITSSDVTIKFNPFSYQNKSYAAKSGIFTFSLSRTYNVRLEYDIFSTLDDANNKTNILLSNAVLDSGDANDILASPANLSSSNNKLTLNLYPQVQRRLLLPGVTYYMRVSAFESNGDPAGYAVQSFKIDEVVNIGALIYVANATENSLSFQVSIDDKQHSIMGALGTDGENAGSLYAVRFVDSEDRLIHTTYDDKVFKAGDLKKLFVLDSSTITNESFNLSINKELEMNQEYTMKIYAVADKDHNGIFEAPNPSSTSEEDKYIQYGPSDFFLANADKTAATWGDAFNEIIDSFWTIGTDNVEDLDELENAFLISSASQRTTNESGWVINDEGISLERTATGYYRIKFGSSYGLIENGTPVFKRIDWSISGYSASDIINDSGIIKAGSSIKLIQSGQNAGGYDFYYFDLPTKYDYGEYFITIQLRLGVDDPSPNKTISVRT